MDLDVVGLSRLQFAMTALYHFLFVPLTIGLAVLLAIMETVYVMTGRTVWRQMTKFWGVLFGINFALGVSTGIVMEFQFGMNWSYYSHYVGDIFGAPLAIEGLMAFFLEATFVGMFFFGWERMSKVAHCIVTWLVALGSLDTEVHRVLVLVAAFRQGQERAAGVMRLREGSVAQRLDHLLDLLQQATGEDIFAVRQRQLPQLREIAGIINAAPESVCRNLTQRLGRRAAMSPVKTGLRAA